MRCLKNYRCALIAGSLAASTISANAAQISYEAAGAMLDNAGSSDFLGLGAGRQFSIFVAGVSPDGPAGTTGTAYNQVTDTQISMRNWASDGRPGLFGGDFDSPFDEGTFTPWEITLQNGNDTLTVTTPNRESVEAMGYVRNLSLSGRATAPRAEWDRPAGNERVDFYQYELWNADEGRVLIGNVIPENIGSQTFIPAEDILDHTNLERGTKYALRVFASRSDSNGLLESRSTNWIEWEATGGQAEGDVLRLETGSPVTASSQVDVPDESFNLAFDYRFETESGELSVSLGGESIGQTLMAPEEGLSNEFLTAFFEVDIESILGQNNQLLTLTLEGQTGSRVLLDNLRFGDMTIPGGDFSDDLDEWEITGEGTASIIQIPLPPSLLLMLAGLIPLVGFAGTRARMAR